jgi:glyoxylase-like metal-dependent hydrolase (beta-lactamase superfamily II)
MGALPYLLKEWPDAVVCASEKAKKVFQSQGARRLIEKMGKNAANQYRVDDKTVIVDNIRVDHVLHEGDKISLGLLENGDECMIEALETKGHTDCCLSYMIQPEKILLCSESCGVFVNQDAIEVAALKSFDETINSANRLKTLEFNHLYSPHYGMVPDEFRYEYFNLYIRQARKQQLFIRERIDAGMSFEEILAAHELEFRQNGRNREQPYEAYRINAENEIRQEITNYHKCNSEIS